VHIADVYAPIAINPAWANDIWPVIKGI